MNYFIYFFIYSIFYLHKAIISIQRKFIYKITKKKNTKKNLIFELYKTFCLDGCGGDADFSSEVVVSL